MDALDALLAFGYRVVKETPHTATAMAMNGPSFRLCGAKAFISCHDDKRSIALLLQEIEETARIEEYETYYVNKIIDIGKRLP